MHVSGNKHHGAGADLDGAKKVEKITGENYSGEATARRRVEKNYSGQSTARRRWENYIDEVTTEQLKLYANSRIISLKFFPCGAIAKRSIQTECMLLARLRGIPCVKKFQQNKSHPARKILDGADCLDGAEKISTG